MDRTNFGIYGGNTKSHQSYVTFSAFVSSGLNNAAMAFAIRPIIQPLDIFFRLLVSGSEVGATYTQTKWDAI